MSEQCSNEEFFRDIAAVITELFGEEQHLHHGYAMEISRLADTVASMAAACPPIGNGMLQDIFNLGKHIQNLTVIEFDPRVRSALAAHEQRIIAGGKKGWEKRQFWPNLRQTMDALKLGGLTQRAAAIQVSRLAFEGKCDGVPAMLFPLKTLENWYSARGKQ